jgi:hypothetical protein
MGDGSVHFAEFAAASAVKPSERHRAIKTAQLALTQNPSHISLQAVSRAEQKMKGINGLLVLSQGKSPSQAVAR